jgi:hypothetical protein
MLNLEICACLHTHAPSLIVGIVRLDKSLCRSHDLTLVQDGLPRLEKRGSLVGETEHYKNERLDQKYLL